MNKDEYYWSKLQDYAEGKLTEAEALEIQQWMGSQEEAQEVVEGYRMIKEEISDDDARNSYYKSHLARITNQIDQKSPASPFRYLVAASIFMIGGIASYLIFQNAQEKTAFDQLLAEYSQAFYSAPFATRNGFENQQVDWVKAYRQLSFRRAKTYLLAVDHRDERETFYLGMTYFYLGEYNTSILHLTDHTLEGSLFIEQAMWYCALAYLQVDKIDEGRTMLANISTRKTFHYKEAKQLLEALED